MNKEVSLAEAKATLSKCIRDVEKGLSVIIKRHGRPVAALVHPQDLENLDRLKKAGPEGGLASLAGGVAIGLITDHYTSAEKKPAQEVSKDSLTGSATNIISGLALGMRSTAAPATGSWRRRASSSRSAATTSRARW